MSKMSWKQEQALERLRSNDPALLELCLHCEGLGVKAAGRLAEALQVNHTLLKLGLGFNNIGNQGALRLGEVLKSNKTL